MSVTTIFYILLAIVSVNFLFDQLLDYLNLKSHTTIIPAEFAGVYSEEKYVQAYEYHKTKTNFGFLTASISFIASIAMIYLGLFGWIDELLKGYFANDILRALAFFGILFIASDVLTLPFQWYSTFVIEEKFGFNKMTKKLFVADKIKGWLLTAIIGGVILGALLWLVQNFGENFWFYFWVVIAAFILFMNMFYASLIMPMFNKLTPLENGELRQAIETYSKSVEFPLANIFVIDGSKRSTKANAFFSGFGSQKKIVLYDTLIKNHSIEELVAVLAHEVGHYKKKHLITSLILSLLQTGVILFILSKFLFSTELTAALGGQGTAIHLNLVAFGLLFSPISMLIGIIMNIVSRKNEYEADDYARTTYNGNVLGDALKKLSVDNLSNLTPHPLYEFINYSHPTVLERLRALKK